MPWSVWVVAAAVVAAMIAQVAKVVAYLTVLAGAIIAALFLNAISDRSLVTVLAKAIGVAPAFMGLGLVATIVFAVGLLFLFLGTKRGQGQRVFLHTGILILGFVLASVVAIYRMPPWAG